MVVLVLGVVLVMKGNYLYMKNYLHNMLLHRDTDFQFRNNYYYDIYIMIFVMVVVELVLVELVMVELVLVELVMVVFDYSSNRSHTIRRVLHYKGDHHL